MYKKNQTLKLKTKYCFKTVLSHIIQLKMEGVYIPHKLILILFQLNLNLFKTKRPSEKKV
jgi:hypothetical protein